MSTEDISNPTLPSNLVIRHAHVAPATGLAAAAADLMGGDLDDMIHAMQSVIGTFAGMIYDGAKLSCAFKVSMVAKAAVEMAALVLDGAYIPNGNGVVGQSIEETIKNLAQLNDPGMRTVEQVVLQIMGGVSGGRSEVKMPLC